MISAAVAVFNCSRVLRVGGGAAAGMRWLQQLHVVGVLWQSEGSVRQRILAWVREAAAMFSAAGNV